MSETQSETPAGEVFGGRRCYEWVWSVISVLVLAVIVGVLALIVVVLTLIVGVLTLIVGVLAVVVLVLGLVVGLSRAC